MQVDIGKVGELYFCNSLGIGFDAQAVAESQKIKRVGGSLVYLLAILKTIFLYKNHPISIYIDGVEENRDIFMISIGNGAYMGGGFKILPKARTNDSFLDVSIIKNLTKREIFVHLPKVVNGSHLNLPQVDYFQVKQLVVESKNSVPVQTDGELLSPNIKKLEIEILPGALQVIHNLN